VALGQQLFDKHPLVKEIKPFKLLTGVPTDLPVWDYEKHGTDWDFLNCNKIEDMLTTLSPRNMSYETEGSKYVFDFKDY